MPEMISMTSAELEKLLEDKLRAQRDASVGTPATNANLRGTSAESDREPSGAATRGTVNPMFPVTSNLRKEDATSILRFLRGVNENDGAEVRAAQMALGMERVQNVATGTDGGFTVPEQFVAEVVVALPRVTVFADGRFVRIVPMTNDTMKWTKVKTKPAEPGIVQEQGTYGTSGVEFGTIELIARKIGQIIPFTEEILEANAIGMVSLIAELVAEQLGYKRNKLVTNGTGAGEPEGLLQNAGFSASVWDATSQTTKADSIITAYHALPSQYRANAIWMFHDSRIAVIRKLKDSNNRYLWTDGFASAPATLLGRPVFENPDLPINLGGGTDESVALFGDLKRAYVIGQKSGLVVQKDSSGDDWKKDLVNFKFRERYDGKVSDETAMIKVTGVK